MVLEALYPLVADSWSANSTYPIPRLEEKEGKGVSATIFGKMSDGASSLET